jgi:hypothetical protein
VVLTKRSNITPSPDVDLDMSKLHVRMYVTSNGTTQSAGMSVTIIDGGRGGSSISGVVGGDSAVGGGMMTLNNVVRVLGVSAGSDEQAIKEMMNGLGSGVAGTATVFVTVDLQSGAEDVA